jgi:chromate reductase, NAD(P)H dehydrogenase (quinone)
MARIIGIAGSLRRGSYNRALLARAAELTPAGTTIEIHTIDGIPLYDGDVEAAQGIPPAAATLKDAIAGADGLLLVTPEYNYGIPGVFKNAIDWMSRPPKDQPRVFGGKTVGLIGASQTRGGTRLSQNAWLSVIRSLGLRPWFGKELYIAQADKVFDAAGVIVDPTIQKLLAAYVTAFAEAAAAR